jgi:hypothetical protein
VTGGCTLTHPDADDDAPAVAFTAFGNSWSDDSGAHGSLALKGLRGTRRTSPSGTPKSTVSSVGLRQRHWAPLPRLVFVNTNPQGPSVVLPTRWVVAVLKVTTTPAPLGTKRAATSCSGAGDSCGGSGDGGAGYTAAVGEGVTSDVGIGVDEHDTVAGGIDGVADDAAALGVAEAVVLGVADAAEDADGLTDGDGVGFKTNSTVYA